MYRAKIISRKAKAKTRRRRGRSSKRIRIRKKLLKRMRRQIKPCTSLSSMRRRSPQLKLLSLRTIKRKIE